jgi:hypothetical protein
MKRLKIQTLVIVVNSNSCDCGPNGSVQEFCEVDFGFDPKISFHPHDLFCHHANVQKLLESGRNCFKR